MSTNNQQPEQSQLEMDIDSVFGPTVSPQQEANDVDDENDEGEGGTQQAGGEQQQGSQEQNADGEGGGEDDPLGGFAPALKAPPLKDAQGNIVDKDGNIIARGRTEKREMYAFNKLRAAADKISQDRDRLRQENEQLRTIKDMPGRLGLSLDQTAEAMEFRAKLERDPVTTVRDIVARVLGNGYTMEQLFGADAPGYINAQIMQRQLDDRMRPLNERLANEDREARIAETARRDTENFISEHEYADVHGEAIVQIVNQHDVTPQKAYYELRQWAVQNGFDFSQPLRPQVVARLEAEAKKGGGDQRQAQQPTQQRTQVPSTPGGTRAPGGVQQSAQPGNGGYAQPDSSYRDIVSQAFKDFANGGATQH